MSLSLWNDPFFRQTLGDPFSEVLPCVTSSEWMSTSRLNIKGDLLEKDNCYNLILDVPGIAKKDIDVSLEGDSVIISGNKPQCCDIDVNKDYYHFKERGVGRFTRTFKLPSNADFSKANATHIDGVLILTFPKVVGTHPSQQKLMIR